MECKEVRAMLSLYIDKMLDENQAKQVEEHLMICDACNYEYAELKNVVEMLNEVESVSFPDLFGTRLKMALKEEAKQMERVQVNNGMSKKQRWRIMTSIAAVFAICIVSYGLYNDMSEINPNSQELLGSTQDISAEKSQIQNSSAPDIAAGKSQLLIGSAPNSAAVTPQEKEATQEMIDEQGKNDTQSIKFGMTNSPGSDNIEQATQNSAGDTVAPAAASEVAPAAAKTPNTSVADAATDTVGGAGAPAYTASSQPVTAPGIENDAATITNYESLINQKLDGFEYQFLDSSYLATGECRFKIFIFRGKDGNTFNEEISIVGKDGEIKVVSANKFMGL